jgi:two-component system, cell cycle sensor histidine kinase and response regulator CckA
MPGMGGREVAEVLRRRQPGLPVLYVSGHAQDFILNHGVSEAGVDFLPKPFTASALLARVRDVLDAAPKRSCAT